jgi:hypothetical protein
MASPLGFFDAPSLASIPKKTILFGVPVYTARLHFQA